MSVEVQVLAVLAAVFFGGVMVGYMIRARQDVNRYIELAEREADGKDS